MKNHRGEKMSVRVNVLMSENMRTQIKVGVYVRDVRHLLNPVKHLLLSTPCL